MNKPQKHTDIALSNNAVLADTLETPLLPTTPIHREPGCDKGLFVGPDDFNEPLPKEIEDLFYD